MAVSQDLDPAKRVKKWKEDRKKLSHRSTKCRMIPVALRLLTTCHILKSG